MKIDTFFSAELQQKERMKKKVFALTGSSNSGKTTLMEDLIFSFKLQGYHVSAIKHAHQGFDIDRPGKDSYRMREAGAQEVFLMGDKRWALLREYADEVEPSLQAALDHLAPCDLVLVEGFKSSDALKIEVFRPSAGRPPLWPKEQSIIAVASDEPVDCPLPLLPLNQPDVIVRFIQDRLNL